MKRSHLRRTAALIAATGLVVSTAHGAETATVLQYELSLGGARPVSTFYFAYQPAGAGEIVASGTDSVPAAIRMPVYSTDPTMATMLSGPSLLMSAADGEKPSIGEALLGVVGAVLVFGAPIYAVGKTLKEAGEIDLSGIEYPEIDPSLLEPQTGQ